MRKTQMSTGTFVKNSYPPPRKYAIETSETRHNRPRQYRVRLSATLCTLLLYFYVSFLCGHVLCLLCTRGIMEGCFFVVRPTMDRFKSDRVIESAAENPDENSENYEKFHPIYQ